MMIFWVAILLILIVIMVLKGLWNIFMHKRLVQLFPYQFEKDEIEWNEEYAETLKEKAISKQEIDDFQLLKVLQKCDFTYTNIGREYMYGRMLSKQCDHHLLEMMVQRYQNPQILSDTLYHLYQLSKEYDACLGLFQHSQVFSLWEKRLIMCLGFCPIVFIIMWFFLGGLIFLPLCIYAALMILLNTYYSQRTKTIVTETMSYCFMIEALSHLVKHRVFPEEDIQKLKPMLKKAKTYTVLARVIYKISKIDVFYFTQTIQSFFMLSLHQYLILLKHQEDMESYMLTFYEYLGTADVALSVRLVRERYVTCLPELTQDKQLSFVEAYHPLISNPVKNSFSTTRSCMITGSNASGKSTFLKMIGINMLMAKTLHTCFADEWKCYHYTIHSAIHMKDDLTSGDSYYVKEIKTLKAMIDDVKEKDCMIFIDEILRGTNEKERVMISQAILTYLFQSSSLILVTTHDLSLVEKFPWIDQYCFRDAIVNNQLSCDYKIHQGRCTVGNAIALLEIYGYDADIINAIRKPN